MLAPLAAAAPDLTGHWAAPLTIGIFAVAYLIVMGEEKLHIRKSLPVIVAAGIIWVLVAVAFGSAGQSKEAELLFKHNLLDFAELFLFLLAAMTFINTMEERGVFEALRNWLIGLRLSLRALFWVTGLLAFFLSPIADNLTTALVMGAVTLAVGVGKRHFIALSCINIVVAANAGGAFSPFGDITTLMVWQKGQVTFFEFMSLFWPSVINWLVPAAIMSFGIEKGMPEVPGERVVLKAGALTVVTLLLATIALAVTMHNSFHLPPVLGMMTGLGVLNVYAYWLRRRLVKEARISGAEAPAPDDIPEPDEIFAEAGFKDPQAVAAGVAGGSEAPAEGASARPRLVEVDAEASGHSIVEIAAQVEVGGPPDKGPITAGLPGLASALLPRRFRNRERRPEPLDVLRQMERTEWDTLMFFYGVILCVGGLGALGYLTRLSVEMYGGLGPTWANVLVGILSAIVDNIPIMFAVLSMNPDMSHGQWLLVTLTAGVGGSLLSIGSAAGVALMGQARGVYTFLSHLRWTWAVGLGYAASVGAHLALNRSLF